MTVNPLYLLSRQQLEDLRDGAYRRVELWSEERSRAYTPEAIGEADAQLESAREAHGAAKRMLER